MTVYFVPVEVPSHALRNITSENIDALYEEIREHGVLGHPLILGVTLKIRIARSLPMKLRRVAVSKQEAQLLLGWPTVLPHSRRSIYAKAVAHSCKSVQPFSRNRHRAVYPN